jgi:hypothetical protein
MFFDDFNGILTVIGRWKVGQYSLNGALLHSTDAALEVAPAVGFGIDFSFDARVVVLGHSDGSVSFLAVDAVDYQLKTVARRRLHSFAIISVFFDGVGQKLTTVDERGIALQTEVPFWDAVSVVRKCGHCNNEVTGVCPVCKGGTCGGCRNAATEACSGCSLRR